MAELEKVSVTIVTGFPGAGKTTLIAHLLRNPGGRRWWSTNSATWGVDGEILRGCALPDCPQETIL